MRLTQKQHAACGMDAPKRAFMGEGVGEVRADCIPVESGKCMIGVWSQGGWNSRTFGRRAGLCWHGWVFCELYGFRMYLETGTTIVGAASSMTQLRANAVGGIGDRVCVDFSTCSAEGGVRGGEANGIEEKLFVFSR